MGKNNFLIYWCLLNSIFFFTNAQNSIMTGSDSVIKTAGRYYKIADSLSKVHLFNESINYLNNAMELYILHDDWENEVLCLNHIGWNFLECGNLVKAESMLQDALTKSIKTGGHEHHLVAQNYNTLGILYEENGDLEKSHSFHQKALSLRLKIFGENNIEVAKSYANGGVVFRRTGDYEMAINYYERALKIVKNIMGEKNIFVAGIYSNLGNIFTEYLDNDKAINYHLKSLKIWIELTDSTHPFVGKCLNNIGIAFTEKSKETSLSIEQHRYFLDKASRFLKKSLKIREEKSGLTNPEVATALMNLSLINTDDYDSSMYYLNRAKIIYLQNYDKGHQFVGKLYYNIAILNLKHHYFQESLLYLQNSFYSFVYDFGKESTDFNKDLNQKNPEINHVKNPMFLLDALLLKAEVLYTIWEFEK